MVNVLAAMGVAQMEQLPVFIERKKTINQYYRDHLYGIGDISFQQVQPAAEINYWLFTFRTKERQALLEKLNNLGIQSRPFWKPMNQLPMFVEDIYVNKEDVSNKIYMECLSIPSSTFLKDDELQQIVQAIKQHYDS